MKVKLYKPIKKKFIWTFVLSDQLLNQHKFILKSVEILL